MMDNEKYAELFEIYMTESELFSKAYEIMGRLLDQRLIIRIIECIRGDKLIIYGCGYIGLQLYYALSESITITVVDRSKKSKNGDEQIEVIDEIELRKTYKNEKVIITPLQYTREIYDSLIEFVPIENIILIGELVFYE